MAMFGLKQSLEFGAKRVNSGRSPPRIADPPDGAAIWLRLALRSYLGMTWLA